MEAPKSSGRVTVRDLVDTLSRELADRHPEKWAHPTDPEPMRRTIVAAINAHGWPPDGIPGVLHLVCMHIETGVVEAFSMFNDLACGDVSLVHANPAQWYVTGEGESTMRELIGTTAERTKDEHHQAQGSTRTTEVPPFLETHSVKSILYNNSDEPDWDKYADFRTITPREAVLLMHGLNPKAHATAGPTLAPPRLRRDHGSGTHVATTFFERVSHRVEVAERDNLPARPAAEWLHYAGERAWTVCDDFRALAEPKQPQTGPAASTVATKPLQRSQAQELVILEALRTKKYDPQKLPSVRKGARDDPKSVIRKIVMSERPDLFQSVGVYDKAWERLSADTRIRRNGHQDAP